MANEIGVVTAIIGSAMATATDGSIRYPQVGDSVFADELISTGPDGAIEIEFADGDVMDLGRSSQAMLDEHFYDLNSPSAIENQDNIPTEQTEISFLIDGQGNDILSGDNTYQSEPDRSALFINKDIQDVVELADVLSNPDNQLAGFEYDGYLQIQVSNSEGLVQLINLTSVAASDDISAQATLDNILSSDIFDDGFS